MLRRQLIHFALAGTLGFLVDAAVVQSLVRAFGCDPYLARIPAVLLAILTTFAYNRQVTFADRRSQRIVAELGRYVLSCSAGLVANYGAYATVIGMLPQLRDWPVVGVAVGSVAGMAVNFVAARYFVFARPSSGSDGGEASG